MSDPNPNPSIPRTIFGGFLMGLANLVPGVSGGTMILAVGLYDRFIGAVAELSSLRWSKALFVFLIALGIGLVTALLGFSGIAVHLVTTQRWIMYSLFIGMALGGVPQLVRLAQPLGKGGLPVVLSMLLGLAAMVWIAFALQESTISQSFVTLALVGAAAASSMILPGISGSYILLIFGMYDTVIGSLSVSELKADPRAALEVLGPIILGAGLGIALLSNILKVVLARLPRTSHGFLLGLLVGSVLGLWPFQTNDHPELAVKPVRKAVTMLVEGSSLEEARAEYEVEVTDLELEALAVSYAGDTAADLKLKSQRTTMVYDPSIKEILSALGLVVVGFCLTWILGGSKKQ